MSFYVKYPASAGGDVTLSGVQTLTNKTLSGLNNTITNISLTTGVTGILPIANGGTNSSTSAGALTNLLPSQTANTGYFLSTNGTIPSWQPIASSGANTTLSNLVAPTAINQSLLPATPFGVSIGSETLGFNTFFGLNIRTDAALNIAISNRYLYGATNILSVDYGNRNLKNAAGNTVFDWSATNLNVNNVRITSLATPVLATDAASKGYVDASIAAGGANTTLSNLVAPTAINQDLLPGTDAGISIGSNTKRVLNINSVFDYAQYQIVVDSSSNQKASLSFGSSNLSGISFSGGRFSAVGAGANNGAAVLTDAIFSTLQSGPIYIASGQNAGTGNSGDITLLTGSTAGGIKGKINLNAVLNLTVQTAPATPVNGDLWFDGTNLKFVVGGVTKTITMI